MKVTQLSWSKNDGWSKAPEPTDAHQLVLVFGARQLLQEGAALTEVASAFQGAQIVGGSTSGEIQGEEVHDDTVAVTAITFESTAVKLATVDCPESGSSADAGEALAAQLDGENLRHVLVISNGLHVNGTDLAAGLARKLPSGVSVTGGLTGDAANFEQTWVVANDHAGATMVAAVGLYGNSLHVGYGSAGGWSVFGPERVVTRAEGNVLYELDGKSALELYKSYLGEHASELPGSGLLFPLQVHRKGAARGVVRTLLAVDEELNSMTFAGDIPLEATVQLMRCNTDRLVDGATAAAEASVSGLSKEQESLAVLVSCVGRKLVMKQRVEEEVEAVSEVLGDKTAITGFYSYGELAPFEAGRDCELHNQTMTVTVLSEA